MGKFRKHPSNYDKRPTIETAVAKPEYCSGWASICAQLEGSDCVVFDHYQGVDSESYKKELTGRIAFDHVFDTSTAMKPPAQIREMVFPDVTDDRVFGFYTRLHLEDFFDPEKLRKLRKEVSAAKGKILVFGVGAALACDQPGVLVYADMARWEIQQRQRANQVNNLGVENKNESASANYKHSYFVDWRVLDRHKKTLFHKWDFVIDANQANPLMLSGPALNRSLEKLVERPFRVVPFFDPGPWGGQWMKEVCGLDPAQENYAWCFDCVPEENSLLLKLGSHHFETPAINLVFQQPKALLGEAVYGRFGDEFPIRFDFLDTMEGGNLSLQVHPLTQYIQEHFGLPYTQDESYYILDAGGDASVYLGVKNGVDAEAMLADLQRSQDEGVDFDAEKYVNKWPAQKHDHFLIPAGTIHCSGSNSMVLEISATPYIFTFKLWDWGRLGLDGQPRPINIGHGEKNIQWDRDEAWVKAHLINTITTVDEGDGWREEKTGLHTAEFIETRRHWFRKKVQHQTHGSVNVLNLVEGAEAVVESPDHSFQPFVVHYAETFIIPEAVKNYTIRPFGKSKGQPCATLKAYVRH